ncbi:MAG TPA: MIP/aquaporin family protein [Anaerolineae bacterium]|nr:aquaporin family protein [Anaerolineae bacterium]MCB0222727.1 aquaporin family protein [Anaerolineae bacterium]HRV94787.1 MIP/aquaporin family protein [Anaerolineae bacterium]
MSIFMAELVGTMILILLGDGVVANVVLSKNKGEGGGGGGAWIVITAGWGFAVAMAVYTVGWVSGAHLNPAVTFGLMAIGGTTPAGDPVAAHLLGYLGGEFVGAFLGAVLVFIAYFDHFKATDDPGLKLAVFSTGPAIRNLTMNLITEIIGTAMLLFGILGIVNANNGLGSGFGPYAIGILIFSIGLSLGGPTGYAINPARDLGPRIAHALLPIPGKGDSDWGYSWVPVVGPIIGGVLGAVLYQYVFLPMWM